MHRYEPTLGCTGRCSAGTGTGLGFCEPCNTAVYVTDLLTLEEYIVFSNTLESGHYSLMYSRLAQTWMFHETLLGASFACSPSRRVLNQQIVAPVQCSCPTRHTSCDRSLFPVVAVSVTSLHDLEVIPYSQQQLWLHASYSDVAPFSCTHAR